MSEIESALAWTAEVRRLRAELAETKKPCPECARKDEALVIARELHQMFSFSAHPGYPARKAAFLRESEWLEMGTKLAALSTGGGEEKRP